MGHNTAGTEDGQADEGPAPAPGLQAGLRLAAAADHNATRTTVRQAMPRAATHALEAIFREGPVSRADLRRVLGTSLSTVTSAVQELVELGLVVESGHAISTGGRPPGLLDLSSDLGGVLAADVGGINVRVAAADCRGQLRFRETHRISVHTADSLQAQIVAALDEARAHLGGPVRAIAVSIAGIVDPRTNRVSRVDNIPGWPEQDTLAWLERFGAPLLVDNEANLAALGEHQAGVGRSVADMLFVAIGAGIGSGLVLNGSLYRGATGAAGEIGLLRRGDPSFSVTLEQVAAAGALIGSYVQATGESVSGAEAVFTRAAAQDHAALAAVEKMVAELAIGIANSILVINPGLVVVGGGLSAAGENLLLSPLRARVEQLVPEMPEIVLSELGPDAALIGAVGWAAQMAQQSLTMPFEER